MENKTKLYDKIANSSDVPGTVYLKILILLILLFVVYYMYVVMKKKIKLRFIYTLSHIKLLSEADDLENIVAKEEIVDNEII